MTKKPIELAIGAITRDLWLQPHATLHQDWIEVYAVEMAEGAKFPPIVVFFDGERHWLADGFHRSHAAAAAGLTTILADVRKGTRRDALLYSVSANAEHGYRRTNDDKRRAVDIMLADPEWGKWSNSEIARRCAVDEGTVRNRKKALAPCSEIPKIDPRLVTRGGSVYEMDTTAIGKSDPAGQFNFTSGHTSPESFAPDPPAAPRAPETPLDAFDWDAARLRDQAMEAIRTLAKLPPAEEVLAAWMKTRSYGEPPETLDAALLWLGQFAPLYREHEPQRWARVLRGLEALDAAE